MPIGPEPVMRMFSMSVRLGIGAELYREGDGDAMVRSLSRVARRGKINRRRLTEMRFQEVYDTLHRQPFQPFRIQLTNGQSHVVRHRDFAWLTRTSVFIGLPSGDDEVPDRALQYDLLHVVGLEPVNGAKPKRRRGGGKTQG